jgi:ABC-type transport system involved in cytochrome c biogenesis permease subunit
MKENWALVSWLLYTVYLHFYKNKALNKHSRIFGLLGFIAIIITMFFVGAMGGDSMHAYSM